MAAKPATDPAYSVELYKLKDGHHEFTFAVDDSFLQAMNPEGTEAFATQGNVQVQLALEKTQQFIDARFSVTGTLQVACDRCLQDYTQIITGTERVLYSYNPDMATTDDQDVVFISRDLQWLDLRQEMYDFIGLQVPLRKIPEGCPGSMCPPEVLKYINTTESERTNLPSADPRWSQLKELN